MNINTQSPLFIALHSLITEGRKSYHPESDEGYVGEVNTVTEELPLKIGDVKYTAEVTMTDGDPSETWWTIDSIVIKLLNDDGSYTEEVSFDSLSDADHDKIIDNIDRKLQNKYF